ncbi:deacetylase-like protein [Neofusicoccum parvum]|nr:deacetylase-like protein [Neofusicoccum parvum]
MDDSQPQPRNRKERRAAAKAAGTPLSSAKAPKKPSATKLDFSQQPSSSSTAATESDLGIPMALPDFSGPKGPTLYEIAEQRMRALNASGAPVSSLEGEEVEFPGGGNTFVDDGEDFGAGAEALLYAFTLTTLHFTLDVLVHNQYREEITWSEIRWRTAQVFPLLWLTIYMFKTPTAMRFATARQLVFLVTAVVAGCYCVHIGNMYGYYAVMKRSPPLGTLWIWTVVEMRLVYAVVSVVAVLGYTWWNKYGLF